MSRPGPSGGAPREAPPLLSDTHVHLNLDSYDDDREPVIRRARDAGVRLLVNVGFDLATSLNSIELAEAHASIYASVGVHPHDALSLHDDLLTRLERAAEHPKVVAVGETGLDYYRDLSPREEQERCRSVAHKRDPEENGFERGHAISSRIVSATSASSRAEPPEDQRTRPLT